MPVDPAKDEVERGIDGSIRRGLMSRLPSGERPNARRRRRGLQPDVDPFWPVATDPLQLVDFKTGENITPYELVRGSMKTAQEAPYPFALLTARYPADLCERMAELYLSGRVAVA